MRTLTIEFLLYRQGFNLAIIRLPKSGNGDAVQVESERQLAHHADVLCAELARFGPAIVLPYDVQLTGLQEVKDEVSA